MTNRHMLTLLMLALSLQAFAAAAQPNASVSSFLSTYVNASTVSHSNYYAQSINGKAYVLMQVDPSSFNRFAVINVTGKYSFVTDNYTAFNVIGPFLTNRFYPNSTELAGINSSMRSFISSSNPPLAQCLSLTGLTYNLCTSATPLLQCLESSCERVPLCGGVQTTPRSALMQFGIPSPFADGILNFSMSYVVLNNSYSSFLNLLSRLNSSDYASNMRGMGAALANITSISATIQNNPIFPTPSNVSIATLTSICSAFTPPNGPWWCYAIGYCDSTTFNAVELGSMNTQLAALQALPVSTAAIGAVTANSTALAHGYLNKIITAEETAEFNSFLSSILPKYNSTASNASVLASRIRNASLSYALQNMESEFAIIKNAGISQNLTSANRTLSLLMANVISLYTRINTAYGGVFAIASNNTYSILVKELDFRSVPIPLARLAGEQQSINDQLNHGINTSVAQSLLSQLKTISSGVALTFAPIDPGSLIKAIDGGIISSLISGSGATTASKISGGVMYATLISLIVAAVFLLLFYLLYSRMKAMHKIKANRRVARAWRSLFIVMAIIAIAYVALTYVYAQGATSFLQFSGFLNALKGSSSVFIAYNSASNASTLSCVSSLNATLRGLGKSITTISLQNYSCAASSNSSLVGTMCLDLPLSKMQPIILIGQGTNSSIIYKGLYGRVLYASGSAVSGASCILNSALKYR